MSQDRLDSRMRVLSNGYRLNPNRRRSSLYVDPILWRQAIEKTRHLKVQDLESRASAAAARAAGLSLKEAIDKHIQSTDD